ncbi:hypothetical protein EZV62_015399 [Acer yangbiense]|uniref:BPL/LPL catalytic domain-containing protein n=1 Tax=Acer yangbiense TaxID=1000413 RepID=A0A5C7HKL2_9ROSI|nr:hypothetical protein EZV62_015399 [Acer yangbiense]
MTMIQQQAGKMGHPLMNLLRLNGTPILQQLQLEEKLLRTSSDNWCIINDGTDTPAIVMGVSGKPSQLLEIGPVLQDRVPVIRRFTGGGTVIVDSGTVFITLICNKDAVPGVQPYPRSIMSWSGLLYSEVFRGLGDFKLRENVPSKPSDKSKAMERSNLLAFSKFELEMEEAETVYLLLNKEGRDHTEFICRLKEYLPRSVFIDKTVESIETYFSVNPTNMEAIDESQGAEFVHSTTLLTRQELEEASASQPKTIGVSV